MRPAHLAQLSLFLSLPLGAQTLLPDLSERLRWVSDDGNAQLQAGGKGELEGHFTETHKPAGLLLTDDRFFFAPRLTVTLDAFWSDWLYAFAKLRADRGVDPGLAPDGQVRADELFVRLKTPEGGLSAQVGRFGTVFGSWAGRRDNWENCFVTEPLAYGHFTTVFDGASPGRAAWMGLQDRADNKPKWLPIIWGPVYNEGALLAASHGAWDLAVAAKSTSLSSRPTVWNDHEYSHPNFEGRLGWHPDARWNFGASAAQGPYLLRNTPVASGLWHDYAQTTLGLDAAWQEGSWQVFGELIQSTFETPQAGSVDTWSYFVEARRQLGPEWFAGLRWNQQFYSSEEDGVGRSTAWDHDVWKLEAALGWRPYRDVQIKIQYGYSDQDGQAEQGKNSVAARAEWRF